jgi:phosphatidate cytidylyltransferase
MFAARVATAAALLTLFCGALLLLPNPYWGLFLLAGLGIASLEWGVLAGYRYGARWWFAGVVLVSGLALLLDSQRGARALPSLVELHVYVYWISVVFWAAVAPAWLIANWHTRNPVILGVVGWVTLLPTWLALTSLQTTPRQLLVLLGIVWIADSAAYVIGRRFGRHRLAPRISPGKTWEGAMGACAAVAVYYAVVWFIFGPRQPLPAVASELILFALITVMSVQGDLFESWMKRQAGVKDSGTLLPGHGGMLDRIDGLTASVPFAALWLHYIDRPGIV